MKHQLQTTLNDADITCVFDVTTDAVVCFDQYSGREYEEQIGIYTLEAVMFQGVDIITTLSPEQVTALEMECQHSYESECFMSKHTPAPWTYNPSANGIYSEANGFISGIADMDKDASQADAALIAAAPELINALELMLFVAESIDWNKHDLRMLDRMTEARAAIAKAGGAA